MATTSAAAAETVREIEIVRHPGGAGPRGRGNGGPPVPAAPAGPAGLMPRDFEDLWRFAEAAAQSKLFPKVQTTAQAFTLMMLCHSKGLHFMLALERYDLIENRPALKTIALAADFKARGWSWKIQEWTPRVASAWFSHPVAQPEPLLLSVRIEEFAHLSTPVWKHYPRKMLWWRLMSLAVDALEPGIKAGLPDAEEARDGWAEDAPEPAPQAPRPALPDPARPRHVEPLVWGQEEAGVDGRPYHEVAEAAAAEYRRRLDEERIPHGPEPVTVKHAHAFLVNAAVQQGLMAAPRDRRQITVLTALNELYLQHRDWVRQTLDDLFTERFEAAREAHAGHEVPAAAEAPDPDPDDYGGAVAPGREPGADDDR